MVTSVECGGAVDVSSDEGGLLFPHSVVPHPSDTTLHMGKTREERKCWGMGGDVSGARANAKRKRKRICDRGQERMRGTGQSEVRKEGMTERGRNQVRKGEYDAQNKRRGSKKKEKKQSKNQREEKGHASVMF